jgi:hypothetical protein
MHLEFVNPLPPLIIYNVTLNQVLTLPWNKFNMIWNRYWVVDNSNLFQ